MLHTNPETLRSFVTPELLFEPGLFPGNAYNDFYRCGTSGTPPPGGSELVEEVTEVDPPTDNESIEAPPTTPAP